MMHREAKVGEGLTGNLTEVALGYQRMLQANPSQTDALIGMSLVALASRQHAAAVTMARAAVASAPQIGLTWVTMGQVLQAEGRIGEAEIAYEKAIRMDGMDVLARMGLGELRIAMGRPEDALEHYDLALRRQPAMVAAQMGMGHALTCMGRNEEALARYQQVLDLAPTMAECEFAIAFVRVRIGQTAEAETHYRRAIQLRPDFAAAWMNLGCLLREQGKSLHAEAALARAVALRAGNVEGWLNLALLMREQRRSDEAERYLSRAFALEPENVNVLLAWCQFRAAEQDLAGAWGWLRWAQGRGPSNAEVVNLHGILLHTERRLAEAVEVFRQAEELGSCAAASNRGNTLMDMGRMEEALHAHELAVQRDPQSAGARYNLALTQLRLGNWAQGWAGYEARWHFREVHSTAPVFRCPRWQGEPLAGRRILLYAEQGLGDAIQFCRYAAMVATRGGEVILQVHEPLQRLMHSLAIVRTGQATVARLGEEPPPFDLECPLMSLPAIFGTTVETVPWPGPYLGADAALATGKWAQTSDGTSDLRVGLAWAGNPRYKADTFRSMQLRTLVPLLRVPGVQWISLQKGNAALQLRELPEDLRVWDASSLDRDLADAAALIATLDLVITTDTSIAHLAGAMGRPVWILLPHLSDWRWMQDVETTPWYPTARLFRQTAPLDWAGVVHRVSAALTCSDL
ncbi:MAG: tetratricopeptide repeat protein [Terracidiphilus sp.]